MNLIQKFYELYIITIRKSIYPNLYIIFVQLYIKLTNKYKSEYITKYIFVPLKLISLTAICKFQKSITV